MADLGPWADCIEDPDFASPFTLIRSLVEVSEQGLAQALQSGIQAQGVVWQGTGKGLVRVGEGDYVEGDLAIVSRTPLDTGDAQRGADIVAYRGRFYTVTNGQAWDFGDGFTMATCKLSSLNPSRMPGSTCDGGNFG